MQLLLRVDTDIVGRRDVGRDREKFVRKGGRAPAESVLRIVAHTCHSERRIICFAHRKGQAFQRILVEHLGRDIQRNRHVVKVREIALHDERIRIASDCRIGAREYGPERMADRSAAKGTFPAEERSLRIVMVDEVLRGKDVRVRLISVVLPIDGKLREEIIVVGVFLHTFEEIVKERTGAVIVLPEYREIVRHNVLSRVQHTRLLLPEPFLPRRAHRRPELAVVCNLPY